MQTTAPGENPFRAPEDKPDWAQLTRLAGDRAAILFEKLRAQLGKIAGLEEELHYSGSELGWTPRYRVGEHVLFTARILPGTLEATFDLASPWREKILNSPGVASAMKEAIRKAPEIEGAAVVSIRLAKASVVKSFAKVVMLKSRFIERNGP